MNRYKVKFSLVLVASIYLLFTPFLFWVKNILKFTQKLNFYH